MAADDQQEFTSLEDAIHTPPEREDNAATDMISGAVEQVMDNIQEAFSGKQPRKSGE